LIELLVAVSIVGILAGLAIPNYRNVTIRARAAAVAADVDAIRIAAVNYNADRNSWPSDAAAGVVPPGLGAFLPDGFSFTGEGYQVDYEVLDLPSGLPGDPNTSRLIAVTVTVPDDLLSNAIMEVMGGAIVASVGNAHTVVIDRS